MNRNVENRTSTKKPIQNTHSKGIGRMENRVKNAIRDQSRSTQHANKNQSQPDLILSYKSADDKNVLALIEIVRTGISFNDFIKIAHSFPFSLTEWSHYLQLSERTIQRNQKEKKSFQPIQSEKIVELAMLYNYGVEVFGDQNNFDVWLNSKSIALGGRTPKELLDTKFGVDMVKDELGRIEHGILA